MSNTNKSFYKQEKQIGEQKTNKNPHLYIISRGKNIQGDDPTNDSTMERSPSIKCKRIKIENDKKQIKFSQHISDVEERSILKGCLRNDRDQKKNNKNIKFKAKIHDVFEYEAANNGMKKKGSTKNIALKQSEKIEGECCQIF